MLPAPASTAAPPRPNSRASWNPAVPPPPVGGAAVGNGLADGLGVGDGDSDGLGVADRDADGVADRDADGLTLALGVVTLAVRLDKAVGVAEMLAPGENLVGAAEGEDAVQAETAAEARMVKVPHPMAVNLALSLVPAVVVRTFIELPHASGRWRPVSGPGLRNRKRKGKRVTDPVAARVPVAAAPHPQLLPPGMRPEIVAILAGMFLEKQGEAAR